MPSDEIRMILKKLIKLECGYCQGDLLGGGNPIDQALASIREVIRKEKNMPEIMLSEYGKGWNAAIETIAELFGKEK